MISIAFRSLRANPCNKALSLLPAFKMVLYLIRSFKNSNPEAGKKILKIPGYLLPSRGINPKSIVNNLKFSKMKKLLAIALIAASFAACNNSADSSTTTDTTTVAPDTNTMMSDTSSKMSTDTSTMSADTSAKK